MRYQDNEEIHQKYYSSKWRKLRKMKLAISPFCERCLADGIYTPAYIIHHKEYITNQNYQDGDVMYNLDNLESLCVECHNKEHFEGKSKKEYIFDSEGNIIKNSNYKGK